MWCHIRIFCWNSSPRNTTTRMVVSFLFDSTYYYFLSTCISVWKNLLGCSFPKWLSIFTRTSRNFHWRWNRFILFTITFMQLLRRWIVLRTRTHCTRWKRCACELVFICHCKCNLATRCRFIKYQTTRILCQVPSRIWTIVTMFNVPMGFFMSWS